MVKHHVGATKKTDINRELTNCNKMLIKKKKEKKEKKVASFGKATFEPSWIGKEVNCRSLKNPHCFFGRPPYFVVEAIL